MNRSTLILALMWIVSSLQPIEASSIENWIDKLFNRNKQATEVTEEHPELHQLTVSENLMIPEIEKKQRNKVVKIQQAEYQRLKAIKEYEVKLLRDDEVIHITIAAAALFAPNDTELLASSDAVLRPLLPCLRTPDYYHMLIVMHSDNTGNESYCYDLTTQRVTAVFDWLELNGGCVEYVVPYAAGSHEPIKPNNTVTGREKNRRLEIYLVPAEEMVK